MLLLPCILRNQFWVGHSTTKVKIDRFFNLNLHKKKGEIDAGQGLEGFREGENGKKHYA